MKRSHKFGRFSLIIIALAAAISFSGCPKKKTSQQVKTPANGNSANNTAAPKKIENPRKKDSDNAKDTLRKEEAKRKTLTEVLKRLVSQYKGLQSMRADVTWVRYNDQLKKSDTSVGKVTFLPKTTKHEMYVRLDWVKPLQESLVIVGDEYQLYRPSLKVGYQGRLSSPKLGGASTGPLAFLSMSKAQIKQHYLASYVGREKLNDGIQTDHITVIPNTTYFFKQADVWVDVNGFPLQVKLTLADGDTDTVQLSNIEKNVTLNANIFRLRLPKGTRVVRF